MTNVRIRIVAAALATLMVAGVTFGQMQNDISQIENNPNVSAVLPTQQHFSYVVLIEPGLPYTIEAIPTDGADIDVRVSEESEELAYGFGAGGSAQVLFVAPDDGRVIVTVIASGLQPFNPEVAPPTATFELYICQQEAIIESGRCGEPSSSNTTNGDPFAILALFETPMNGVFELAPGFLLDPVEVEISLSGRDREEVLKGMGLVDMEGVGPGCSGVVTVPPTISMNWSGGDGTSLTIGAVQRVVPGDENNGFAPTLIVNNPDGAWICGGDGSDLIRFEPPLEGRYDIWIGTPVGYEGAPSVTLLLSENAPD